MSDDVTQTEYAVRFTLDGEEHTAAVGARSVVDAARELVRLTRHHARNKVAANGYRIVRREVTSTPWCDT